MRGVLELFAGVVHAGEGGRHVLPQQRVVARVDGLAANLKQTTPGRYYTCSAHCVIVHHVLLLCNVVTLLRCKTQLNSVQYGSHPHEQLEAVNRGQCHEVHNLPP